jgi:hypothetical protein
VKAHVYVEIGRVVVINYGALAGKVAVIIDVVDQARVSTNEHTQPESSQQWEHAVAQQLMCSLFSFCRARLHCSICRNPNRSGRIEFISSYWILSGLDGLGLDIICLDSTIVC